MNDDAPKATVREIDGQFGLAGMQPKLGAYETWACDDCWMRFRQRKVT